MSPLLLLLVFSFAFGSSSFVFNSSAPCVATKVCQWEDGESWDGAVVPSGESSVVLVASNVSVSLVIDSANITLSQITINGNISLQVQNSSVLLQGLSWDQSSIVAIFGSSFVSITLAGLGPLSIKDSSVAINSASVSSAQIWTSEMNIGKFQLSSNVSITLCNLTFSKVTIWYRANLQISSCPFSSLGQITSLLNQPSTLLVFNSSLSFFGSLTTLILQGGNISITLPQTASIGHIAQQGENYNNSLFAYGGLALQGSSQLNGSIYLSNNSTLTANSIALFPAFGSPCVSGGTLTSYDSFYCPGGLVDVLEVNSIANMTVGTLKTAFMSIVMGIFVDTPSYVIGNVQVASLFIQYSTLYVNGDIEVQAESYIQFYSADSEPALEATGAITFSNVTARMSVGFIYASAYKEMAIARSDTEITASFASIQDTSELSRKLISFLRDDTLYFGDKPPTFGAKNWIYIVYFSIVGVLALVVTVLLITFSTDKNSHISSLDLHQFYPGYFKSSFTLSCGCICFSIFLFPVLLEFVTFTIALGALIPLGFIFGLIEHKFIFIWVVLVFLIQVGGLLDILADIVLLAKVFVYYLNAEFNLKQAGDDSSYEENDQERMLFFARVGLTFAGSIVAMICTLILYSKTPMRKPAPKKAAPKKVTPAPTTNTTTAQNGSTPAKPVAKTTAKPAPKKKESNNFYCNLGFLGIPLLIFMVAMWKVVLVGVRLYLIFVVLKELVTKGKLGAAIQKKIQWIESYLYLDLVFSGIPLGILTLLQLFYYEKDEEFGGDQVFELMKLGALGVDLVGASFLIYFIILGLIHKTSLHHHDHGHHDSSHDSHAPHSPQHEGPEHGADIGAENSVNVSLDHSEDTPLLSHE